ncbi:aspartyl-tRNA(Asn)/glutamyl-tRNA(Gln) amidotransferase subunit A [Roseiarcus fermentans]|uniref:Aspartyl-tRNA(Asn)/glutamyl-tRNA(Gln) amidotransferase subunit A n=2 Tax=Roseiarcus fermentans TaxID=1473586 RepID=A0A366EEU1_9HYPH|nr:amidase [Roseiarcus fermentans]RBP00927.1 aspartyl-tRNA(Asn)/glutamyl-tRNA(Gln) amidotransferase subunit A [Roseiarcus fermentans]
MKPFGWSALKLLSAYRSKTLSPVEAMASVIGRVEAFEPHIAATWLYAPERALKAARASEARWMRAEPIGPLDGVPATVKDNIATEGEPTPVGTAASDMTPARADAPPAARLREAGAILFAKTTMPDYGMLSSGLSSHHALARNPWKLDCNPGGSSSGAGAAAAAQYGPLHVGTDIGGSIRLPAGWCGVVGLKPTAGRVPIDPPYIGRVAGPITRDVADAALMMATLALPDARDYTSLEARALDWAIRPASLMGLTVGLLTEAGCGAPPSDEVRAAVERAARDFAAAGARVEAVAPFLTQEMLDGLDHFWRTRALIDLDLLSPDKRAAVLPFIREWAESADGFSGQHVFRGFSQIPAMQQAAARATERFDVVLTPTAPMTAFPAEWASPSRDPLDPFPHIGFTVAFNMSGQPALSIPCGFSGEGLPIGLQIVGRRFDDVRLLSVARAYEAIRSAEIRPWPEPPSV